MAGNQGRNLGRRQASKPGAPLASFDATPLIGLSVTVLNAAETMIDEDGEELVRIPHLPELAATAAMARCLTPIRLRGSELRAIRKIAGWTAPMLSERLGENIAAATISRWENEKQTMGGFVEKLFRVAACEALKEKAPGVDYDASMIPALRLLDPWRDDPDAPLPRIIASLVRFKEPSKPLTEAWGAELPLAA